MDFARALTSPCRLSVIHDRWNVFRLSLKRINVLNRIKLWLAFNLLFLSINRCVGHLVRICQESPAIFNVDDGCVTWLFTAFYYLLDISLVALKHHSIAIDRAMDSTENVYSCRFLLSFTFWQFDSDISQESQNTIASSNDVDLSFISFRFYDGIYFRAWDNIWLFNGATYFMKSTNKYFVTSSAYIIKNLAFYWIDDHK